MTGLRPFSTRQNIQYNWPKLEQVPDVLAEAGASRDARHTTSAMASQHHQRPLRRVAGDEIADPLPYTELLRQGRRSIRNSPTFRANSRLP